MSSTFPTNTKEQIPQSRAWLRRQQQASERRRLPALRPSGAFPVAPDCVVKDANQSRAASRTSYAAASTGAASAAFYRGDLSIFMGNFFVAAETGRQLIRLRFDPDNASKIVSVERMLQDQIGAVRVVAEGRDGGLYIATESKVPACAVIKDHLVAAGRYTAADARFVMIAL